VVYGSHSQVIKNVAGPCSSTWKAVNLWSNAKARGRWLWNEWYEKLRNIGYLKWFFKIMNKNTRATPNNLVGCTCLLWTHDTLSSNSLVCRALTFVIIALTYITQQWTGAHENFSFIVTSLVSHSNAKSQPGWKQMEIPVSKPGVVVFCVSYRVMNPSDAVDLESLLVCSCFSGIRWAAPWCKRLHFKNYMCTMLLSNARPSQMLKGLGMSTKQSP